MTTADGAVPQTTRQRREILTCALVAAALSAFVVLAVPRGGDLAAHLYRTGLVRQGALIWDNLWFAGQYPLSSYSLLYYLLAAVVGNTVLGIAGVVAAAAIFASVADREWSIVGRWPARAFAILLAGQAFTAAYPYDLGVATLLATLWALQRRRLPASDARPSKSAGSARSGPIALAVANHSGGACGKLPAANVAPAASAEVWLNGAGLEGK